MHSKTYREKNGKMKGRGGWRGKTTRPPLLLLRRPRKLPLSCSTSSPPLSAASENCQKRPCPPVPSLFSFPYPAFQLKPPLPSSFLSPLLRTRYMSNGWRLTYDPASPFPPSTKLRSSLSLEFLSAKVFGCVRAEGRSLSLSILQCKQRREGGGEGERVSLLLLLLPAPPRSKSPLFPLFVYVRTKQRKKERDLTLSRIMLTLERELTAFPFFHIFPPLAQAATNLFPFLLFFALNSGEQ